MLVIYKYTNQYYSIYLIGSLVVTIGLARSVDRFSGHWQL